MILLDSGYLIAIAKPRDSLHKRAWFWANHLHEPFVVTEYVLCETVDALSLPADRAKAHRLVSRLRSHPHCRIVAASSTLLEAGLQLHEKRPDKGWSLTDCISFHVMTQMGIWRALAYDEHFVQAGFEALLRSEPPT